MWTQLPPYLKQYVDSLYTLSQYAVKGNKDKWIMRLEERSIEMRDIETGYLFKLHYIQYTYNKTSMWTILQIGGFGCFNHTCC